MTEYRLSYVKTLLAAMAIGLVAFLGTPPIAAHRIGIAKTLVETIGRALILLASCVALGALVTLYRDRAQAKGKLDLFCASNAPRSEEGLATAHHELGILLRRLWRRVFGGNWLLVGDIVEIRSLEEIRKTLDPSGCLDGLPFMAEMIESCGRQAKVFRCVDKIYDYGRSKKLRRLKDVVLLGGLRCDGSAHGACQASCYLLWKTAWLRPIADTEPRGGPSGHHAALAGHQSKPSSGPYTCQYTKLATASTPMAWWDIRQDVRPLLTGNVTLAAFCVAIITRVFNVVQGARGGVGFPAMVPERERSIRASDQSFAPGDTIRVNSMQAIMATLNDKGRNRGLWFDRDMVKHCGRRYTVRRRVERIIDDATGQMLEMKTPCLVLAGVEASGEFLRFCAQHEYPFWREAWLSSEPGAICSR